LRLIFRVKPLVDGVCVGEAVVIDSYISFYGEVDPATGVHKLTGKIIAGKVLVFKGGRGSTVGSYIIYGLKKSGKNPICMIVEKAEPIIITGAVLAEIPLLQLEDYSEFAKTVVDGALIKHYKGDSVVRVERP